MTRKSTQNIEDQRQAIKLTEEAQSLVENGDLRAAAARLEKARAFRPSDDKILFRLAGLHFDLTQLDTARSYAQEAISLARSQWLYHYLLGLIEKSDRHAREARGSFETALKLNACSAEVHNALGELFLEENDRKQAIACFRRAAELKPLESLYQEHLTAAAQRLKATPNQ